MKLAFVLRAALLGLTVALASPIAAAQNAPPAQVPATQTVRAEIVVLHATNDGTGIDKAIGDMPELAKPPFSSYNSYKLLSRTDPPLVLTKGKAEPTKLPNERKLQVLFKDVIEPKRKEDVRRWVINATIQKPNGNDFLPLAEFNARAGEYFFVAGQTYKGGVLVIGIKILG